MTSGEVRRFAVVGVAAYGTDVLVFNVLRFADVAPVWAKVVSSALAIVVAFAGSRWWTWRDRPKGGIGRESALFVVVSALAAGLQLLCLVVSREVLGLRDALSDNVSANVVGMALATAFRFWAFRTVVFPDQPVGPARGGSGGAT